MKQHLPWMAGLLALCIASLPLPLLSQDASFAPEPEFPPTLELSLTEAIHLALRQNRTIESAYLSRILEKFQLAQNLGRFSPHIDISPTATARTQGSTTDYASDGPETLRPQTDMAGFSLLSSLTQKIPTGGEIIFAWENGFESRYLHETGASGEQQSGLSQWSIGFRQPLLKDGGLAYNLAPIRRAAMQEENNIRSLRDTLISTVSGVIQDYRTLLSLYQDMEVQEDALAKAREQLEVTRIMIETGRRAANEILQSEANLARQELAFEEARAQMDDAHLALLQRLEISGDTTLIPTEKITYKPIQPVFEECLALALDRDNAYLSALTSLELSKISVSDAENQRLWNLDLEGAYKDGWHHLRPAPSYRQEDWWVGLSLKIPLPLYGDAKYNREMPLLSARIQLRKAQMQLLTARESLENNIRNAVRQVASSLKRVELATKTRQFSEENFLVSELQFKLGRISNADFIREQDKLRDDRLAEIRAIMTYQNTLTRLDAMLATTLDTWNIAFITERADLETEYLGNNTWMLNR
ncbi:TolC family protein [Desulfobotulus sp.]|jgi:outer membrane protein TolC|uniref:TolC family protein n=1 Tax=Desulfobotulus sp. TaxID=1940337 RepID=UPI002A3711D9|nr:TolC family protein [Desulfobotulus sp.]MDY0162440.1 TolC family protein [Desulfobotulus sp.]